MSTNSKYSIHLARYDLTLHSQPPVFRYMIYLLEAVWVGCGIFLVLRLTDIFLFYSIPLPFSSMYSIDTALNYTVSQYLCLEWIYRLKWRLKTFPNKTNMGYELILSMLGILISFILQHTFIFLRLDSYAPQVVHFFETYPMQKPSLFLTGLIFTTVWGIAILGRLFILRQINNKKKAQQKRKQSDSRKNESKAELSSAMMYHESLLSINMGKSIKQLKTNKISHVSVEGHYCRFYLYDNGVIDQIYAHIPLKRVIEQLPSDRFIQIHRSHVINTSYISDFYRKGRAYWIVLIDNPDPLPVSRYRFKIIKKSIEPLTVNLKNQR